MKSKIRRNAVAWQRARSGERNTALRWIRDQAARGIPREKVKDLSWASKTWQEQYRRWTHRRVQAARWLVKHAPSELMSLRIQDELNREAVLKSVKLIENQMKAVDLAVQAIAPRSKV